MESTSSIDLINQIIQPFQRSLDEALRVMDCSIDEARCRPAVADDESSPISNTEKLSKSTHATTGPALSLAEPHRPQLEQHPDLPVKSTASQMLALDKSTDAMQENPATLSPETATLGSSGAATDSTSVQKTSEDAVAGETALIDRALTAIEPNSTKTVSAEPVESGPAQTDDAPHGMPISREIISEKPTGKKLSGDMPESADRPPGTGGIERLQSPHRNTSLNPNNRETTALVKPASRIPLKVTENGSLPETVPVVDLNSIIPPAPRPIRRAAGMVAEGLEPVLEQAYGISQQAFEPLTAPIPGEDEAPPATRVSNNFHVNVSMSGTNNTSTEQHEALEEALVDILRLAARRHGLEV